MLTPSVSVAYMPGVTVPNRMLERILILSPEIPELDTRLCSRHEIYLLVNRPFLI